MKKNFILLTTGFVVGLLLTIGIVFLINNKRKEKDFINKQNLAASSSKIEKIYMKDTLWYSKPVFIYKQKDSTLIGRTDIGFMVEHIDTIVNELSSNSLTIINRSIDTVIKDSFLLKSLKNGTELIVDGYLEQAINTIDSSLFVTKKIYLTKYKFSSNLTTELKYDYGLIKVFVKSTDKSFSVNTLNSVYDPKVLGIIQKNKKSRFGVSGGIFTGITPNGWNVGLGIGLGYVRIIK